MSAFFAQICIQLTAPLQNPKLHPMAASARHGGGDTRNEPSVLLVTGSYWIALSTDAMRTQSSCEDMNRSVSEESTYIYILYIYCIYIHMYVCMYVCMYYSLLSGPPISPTSLVPILSVAPPPFFLRSS